MCMLQMQTRKTTTQEKVTGVKRARATHVPHHITCILAERCTSGSLRGFQPRTARVVSEYADGFMPCMHWACPFRRGDGPTCVEIHKSEKCKLQGRYSLDGLKEAMRAAGELEVRSLCILLTRTVNVYFHMFIVTLC